MIFAAYQISCGRWAIYAWEPEAFPLPPVRVVAVITLADANRGRLDLLRRKAGRRRIGSGQIAHSLKNRAADKPRAMAAARNLMSALPIDVLDQIATHVAPLSPAHGNRMSDSFRIAVPSDAENLSRLVNSAYRGDSSRRGWTTEADLLGGQRTDPDTLRELVSENNSTILLTHRDADLIGCVFLKQKADSAYLGMLTVQPNLQGGGIGRRLLAAAENWVFENWRFRRIEMTVIRQRSKLIAWYERRGYVSTHRIEPFPYGEEKFGLPKRPDLEFIVLEKHLRR